MKNKVFTYTFYLLFYSVGGFFLERIINIIFLGTPYDNSFLYGPYQPLYGFGILFTILVYDFLIKPYIKRTTLKYVSLLIAAIIFTGLVETITGELLQVLTNKEYWDYQLVFPMCTYPYSCTIPTSIFGVISMLVILFLHPKIADLRILITNKWIGFMVVIFVIDVVFSIAQYL